MGTFQVNGTLSIKDNLRLWSDTEGANIRFITASDSNKVYELDTNGGNLRLYYCTDGGTGASGYKNWLFSPDGSLTAAKFIGSLQGNADTATKLKTARTISLTGSVTGSGSFDGSGNLSISTTTNHNHDSVYVNVTGDTMSGTLTSNASSSIIQVMNDSSNWRNVVSWRNTTQESGTYLSGLGRHNTGGNGTYPGCITILPYATNSSPWGRGVGLSISKDNVMFEGHTICDNTGKVYGAVWNDYAEYRESDCKEFGRVLIEKGDDSLTQSTERLQHFAGISSDTWGFCQGETEKAKTPIAVAGRVLAYPYQNRNNYKPGDCVCAAPGGTVDIMTREEVRDWPDRIIGTVSCIPDYEEWGSGDRDPVKVNGRIWIKVK